MAGPIFFVPGRARVLRDVNRIVTDIFHESEYDSQWIQVDGRNSISIDARHLTLDQLERTIAIIRACLR